MKNHISSIFVCILWLSCPSFLFSAGDGGMGIPAQSTSIYQASENVKTPNPKKKERVRFSQIKKRVKEQLDEKYPLRTSSIITGALGFAFTIAGVLLFIAASNSWEGLGYIILGFFSFIFAFAFLLAALILGILHLVKKNEAPAPNPLDLGREVEIDKK